MALEIGSQSGAYRIDALLGRGGMAEVYKAWNTGLHRHEALKLLPPQMTHDKSFVARFLNEARLAASLHHPHIATIHNVSDVGAEQPYFTMELVEGLDLSELLHRRGTLTLGEALPILAQIGEALDYAHSHGVVHRDIKPANILLQNDGRGGWNVKVVDFGIARAQEAENGARLTKTGMIVGTPEYMSPEQAGNGAALDRRTDIYSLGTIAYEMLCGQPPFRKPGATSPIPILMAHINEAPAPPARCGKGVPGYVSDAVMKALAKSPADRWNHCGRFVEACTLPSAPSGVQAKRPHPLLLAALACVVLIGAICVGVGLTHARQEPVQTSATAQPLATPETAPVSSGTAPVPSPAAQAPDSGTSNSPTNESAAPPTGGAATTADWQSYNNGRFALDYPSGWVMTQTPTSDGDRVQFRAPAPFVSVLVDTSTVGGTSPLAQWQGLDQRFRLARKPGYQLLGLDPGMIDGSASATWAFLIHPRGQPLIRRIDVDVDRGGVGHALLLSAPAASFGDWRSTFDRIQRSFHLAGQ